MAEPNVRHITLAGPGDLAGFKQAARRLVLQGVPPDQVVWQVAGALSDDLFAALAPGLDEAAGATRTATTEAEAVPRFTVPAFYPPLCEKALLHSEPGRFGLLYRLLWRLRRDAALRSDPLDMDRVQAERLARAVRRDMHKMTAFVRFRPLEANGEMPWHVAWFEPEHHIVEASAPFFARRFAQMRWAILTPQRCVRWDGRDLSFGPGTTRDQAPPADAGEQLWLTYYEHIFNPARLKLKTMNKEMPRRYWANLPEAVLIHPLTQQAAQRSGQMLERAPTLPAHRRPAASWALRVQAGAAQAGATEPLRPGLDAPEELHDPGACAN